MKRNLRFIIGCVITTGFLLFTTDSCIKPNATGTCYVYCACGNCGTDMSAPNNTKSECESWYNTQKTVWNCTCGCTWNWAEY